MDYNYSGYDRRRYQRLKLNLSVNYRVENPWQVRIKFGDREFEATALNLSEGGMAILTNCDIPIASSLILKFSLFKINKFGEVNFYNPVEISGQVRSNMISEKDLYRLGLCFTREECEENKRIGNFVKLAS